MLQILSAAHRGEQRWRIAHSGQFGLSCETRARVRRNGIERGIRRAALQLTAYLLKTF
jgi:hypothetical protein